LSDNLLQHSRVRFGVGHVYRDAEAAWAFLDVRDPARVWTRGFIWMGDVEDALASVT